ncbi:MAG: trypsin-like peptidase domain-containing protein [Actinomycetota bacterium]|nr:trypsin-like peptidase domain-containing protein [Actinomycetota bacterium]
MPFEDFPEDPGDFDEGDLDPADDDDDPLGLPLPPEDRLWRHPSEIGSQLAGARRTSSRPRTWMVGIVAGSVGALLAAALSLTIVELRGTTVVERVIERAPSVAEPIDVPAVLVPDTDTPLITRQTNPALARVESSTPLGVRSGTAISFRRGGYFVTRADLLANEQTVTVVLPDGEELEGRVVGADEFTNVGVVQAERANVPVARFGTANDLVLGDPIIVLGLDVDTSAGIVPTVTKGLISGMDRRLDPADGAVLHQLLQTDARISPGSLGGPMLDVGGDVVGLVTAVQTDAAGAAFGYVTPADQALDVANSLVDGGTPSDVWLGVQGSSLSADVADDLGLAGGALVGLVEEESPAQAAGLAVGDVITAVDGTAITSRTDLELRLREHAARQTIEVEYLRDGAIARAYPILARPPRPAAGSIWGVN